MPQPNVLIVEDDLELARMLHEIVDIYGMSAGIVGDGAQAMDCLKGNSFDLVLLDMSLPTLSGQEILMNIRFLPHLTRTKVAIMTGNTQLTSEQTQSADFLLIKPFTLNAFEDMLSQIAAAQA